MALFGPTNVLKSSILELKSRLEFLHLYHFNKIRHSVRKQFSLVILFSISALLFFPSYISPNNNLIPSASAAPPVPAVLYGADSVSNLYSINPSDGSYTPIGSGIGSAVTGIDFNSTGFLYGADGNVTTISTTTGVGAYAYSKSAACTGGFAFDPAIKPNPRFICGLVYTPLFVVNGLNPNGSFLSITSHLLDPSDTSSFGGLSVGPDNNIYFADAYGVYRIIQPVNSASFSLFAPLDFSAFSDTNCGVISLSFDTSGKLYGAVSCDTSQYLATIDLSNGPSTTPIAVSKVAQSVPGLAAIAFVHTIPSPPSSPIASTVNGTVSLTWTIPTSTGGSAILGYNVYRSTTPGGEGTTPLATVTNAPGYTDNSGLVPGQTYYYTIKAFNISGLSPSSNEVYLIVSPVSPSALTATPGNSQVSLSWTAPSSNGGSSITGYNIYRGTTAGGESATPIATGVTSTSFVDTGVTNGQTYYYVIKAVNSAGTSSASNEANATPAASTSTPFAKKSGVVENLSMLTPVTKDDQHDIREAAKDVTESVAPTLWSTDGIHLNTKKGEHVFDEEKEAVRHIMDVLKDGKESIPVSNSLRNDITQLVDVDNMLATTAINDAQTLVTHLSGNDAKELQHDIDDAQKEMNNAAVDNSKGNFDDVIEHYKHAWKDVTDNDDDVKHDDHKDTNSGHDDKDHDSDKDHKK